MRGVGGPLLCIGDLLSDVGRDDTGDTGGGGQESPTPSSPTVAPRDPSPPSDLQRLFEENYNQLIQSLAGNDHSWTALTLQLCSALKTADKLVNAANSNIEDLLEKVAVLESILARGDSAVAKTKAIHHTQNNEKQSSASSLDGNNLRADKRTNK